MPQIVCPQDILQLGNLCARAGKKLELDENGVITNGPSINDLAWCEPSEE